MYNHTCADKHPLALLKALHPEFPQCCCHLNIHPRKEGDNETVNASSALISSWFKVSWVKRAKGGALRGGMEAEWGTKRHLAEGRAGASRDSSPRLPPEPSWETPVSAESGNNRHEWRQSRSRICTLMKKCCRHNEENAFNHGCENPMQLHQGQYAVLHMCKPGIVDCKITP